MRKNTARIRGVPFNDQEACRYKQTAIFQVGQKTLARIQKVRPLPVPEQIAP
jgi:hypothetical protein